jgi:hypothetical protein
VAVVYNCNTSVYCRVEEFLELGRIERARRNVLGFNAAWLHDMCAIIRAILEIIYMSSIDVSTQGYLRTRILQSVYHHIALREIVLFYMH